MAGRNVVVPRYRRGTARALPAGSLWRRPDFLKLWLASTISRAGSQVSLLALPLTAVLTLHASPAQLGFLVTAGAAPSLLFGLVAGAWVDRLPRRPLLIAADLGRAALYSSIPVAALLGRLGLIQLAIVAFGAGAFSVLSSVASGAFLPAVVPSGRLVEANGRLQAAASATEVVGPGLGGALVQALSAPVAIAADALSYLVSALLVVRLRIVEPPSSGQVRRALWREIAEGLGVTIRHPLLVRISLAVTLGELFDSAFFGQYPLYVTRVVGLAPAALGAIFAIGGAGGLVGAVVAGQVARRVGAGPALACGASLVGIGDALIPLASIVPAVALPTLAIAELLVVFGAMTFGINQASLRQAIVPDRLRGRVGATLRLGGAAAGTLGPLAGGLVGAAIGLRPLFLVAGPCTALGGLILVCSPVWHLRTLPGGEASAVPAASDEPTEGAAPAAR